MAVSYISALGTKTLFTLDAMRAEKAVIAALFQTGNTSRDALAWISLAVGTVGQTCKPAKIFLLDNVHEGLFAVVANDPPLSNYFLHSSI